jgi:hypothetical protein
VQAVALQGDLSKVMRCFGRQCRGQRRVFLKLVRQTERHLLEVGEPVMALGQHASDLLQQASEVSASQRERLRSQLHEATENHDRIAQQSRRLVNGKKLLHGKLVNAYDTTIAAIVKGKSNCWAQFGKKPGICADMVSGFIFAWHLPSGNPGDGSYVRPLIERTQQVIDRLTGRFKVAIHSLAGDLALNDEALRQDLHAQGILTVGIPRTVRPINPCPSQQEVLEILNEAGLNRKRTPYQVHVASACGHSRPVVESFIESLLCRGIGQITYKGHHGAELQMGMTVMAYNAATLVRIQHNRLSKRAQKLRRLLGLKHHNVNEFNAALN